MPTVYCKDDTCKWNRDHFCARAFLDMEHTTSYMGETILQCMNYEEEKGDGIVQTDREQDGG